MRCLSKIPAIGPTLHRIKIMPLGSLLLPLLLLSLPSLQDAEEAADAPAKEPAPVEAAEKAEEKKRVAPPTEQRTIWLSLVGDSWRSLDDPGANSLPKALRELSGSREGVFEAIDAPRYLLIRRLSGCEMAIDAFMLDEEAMMRAGEFVPLDDSHLDTPRGEGIAFDCEWNRDALAARVSAVYVPDGSDGVYGLWLITTDNTPFRKMRAQLSSLLERSWKSDKIETPGAYSAILNGHELSFKLGVGNAIRFRPLETFVSGHADFMQQIEEANPEFLISYARQWRDEKRGVILSYQIAGTDVNLGPTTPFVQWLAGVFQQLRRVDKDKGDIPLELIHFEDARTEVVSDEELKQHYENNERAPEAGVILKVILPRSPYARVCRMNWTEPQEDGTTVFGRVWFVELRDYHRSRSEIVTGATAVMLLAEANREEDLDLLEKSLEFSSCPRSSENRFPALD
jgi:hypothetical protein